MYEPIYGDGEVDVFTDALARSERATLYVVTGAGGGAPVPGAHAASDGGDRERYALARGAADAEIAQTPLVRVRKFVR